MKLADLNSKELAFSKRDFSVSEFESIKNYSKLEVLSIPSGSRIMEDGIEITTERYNSIVEETLSGMSTLKHLLIGFDKITDISFVKNNQLENLLSIDLTHSSVGTHIKDNSNEYTLNPNGIQLLNNNCPNIKCIKTSNKTNITDLYYVQDAISKCNDKDAICLDWRGSGSVGTGYNGFIIWNQNVADTLSKCTEITYFYTREPQPKTLDFSGCKKLKSVRATYLNEEGAGKTIKLPDASLNMDEEGNILGCEVYLTHVTPDFTLTGKACSKLTIDNLALDWSTYDDDTLWKNLKGIDGSNLKEINFSFGFITRNYL